jgi:hypothetical protein
VPNVTSAPPVSPSTEWMHTTFAWVEVHDLLLFLLILILFSALGGGPLLRAMVNWFLRLIGRGVSETIVNVGTPGGDMAKEQKAVCDCGAQLVDPSKCIMHQAEHERSLENKRQIEAMWAHIEILATEMRTGFKDVSRTLVDSQKEITDTVVTQHKLILSALAGGREGFGGVGKGGHD